MRGARPLSAVTLRLASACECRVLVREGTVTQLTGQRRLLLPLLRIFRDFARGVKPSHHKNKTKRNKNTGHVNSGWSPRRVKQRHHGSALTPPPLLSVFRPLHLLYLCGRMSRDSVPRGISPQLCARRRHVTA